MKKLALAVAAPLLLIMALGGSLAYAQGLDGAAVAPSAEGESLGIRFSPLEHEIVPSDYLTVAIEIDNAEALFAVGVEIRFDPSILSVDDAQQAKSGVQILPGTLIPAPYEAENSVDNASGLIDCEFMVDVMSGATAVSGSGTFAIITFQGIGYGTTAVSFESVTMIKQVAGSAVPAKAVIGGNAEITVAPSYSSNIFLPVALRNRS